MEPNWMAIFVAALMPTLVGFIYYHPKVAGGLWMKANGFDADNMVAPKPVLYGLSLLFSVMISMFVAANVTGEGQTTAPDGHSFVTFQHGLVHGAAMTILFAMPVLATMGIFERKSLNWVLVNSVYWLITLMAMGGILSAWR